ncbi:MAG TPA: hypothetical protein DEG96_04155 [Candidatus Atribacteria bacterium]|nr:hypothetical protein [Candidatus Atribacteria bacterium]
MMKKYFGLTLFLVLAIIFLSGCASDLVTPGTENDSTSPTQTDGVTAGKGTLKIYLTDAPGDYSEINIKISKIEGHIAVDGEEGEEEGEEGEGSWIILKEWDEGLLVDLIKLEDVSILLASLELEPNKYTQLRLYLKVGEEEDAWIVIEGSEGSEGSEKPTSTEPLEIPSVYQTGIKLNHPFEIIAGMITKLTIDFDAKKSVIKTGNGKYKLKPVISMVVETYSEEELPESSGSVSGTVSYDGGDLGFIGIGGASVILSSGEYIFNNTTSTSEEPGSEGTFSLDNVPEGNYILNVYADGFNEYSESIEVAADKDTEVNVILLFEETGAISGSVLDLESGLPINEANVTVSLYSNIYTFESSIITDEDGLFSFDQLPVGTYTLNVSAEGYLDSEEYEIVVTAGEITYIDVPLSKIPESLPE